MNRFARRRRRIVEWRLFEIYQQLSTMKETDPNYAKLSDSAQELEEELEELDQRLGKQDEDDGDGDPVDVKHLYRVIEGDEGLGWPGMRAQVETLVVRMEEAERAIESMSSLLNEIRGRIAPARYQYIFNWVFLVLFLIVIGLLLR